MKKTKILALVLSICMLATTASASVYAADATTGETAALEESTVPEEETNLGSEEDMKSESEEKSENVESDASQKNEVAGDFEYSINENKITITNYTGTMYNVVLPSQIDGKAVISIGDSAFCDCSN